MPVGFSKDRIAIKTYFEKKHFQNVLQDGFINPNKCSLSLVSKKTLFKKFISYSCSCCEFKILFTLNIYKNTTTVYFGYSIIRYENPQLVNNLGNPKEFVSNHLILILSRISVFSNLDQTHQTNTPCHPQAPARSPPNIDWLFNLPSFHMGNQ